MMHMKIICSVVSLISSEERSVELSREVRLLTPRFIGVDEENNKFDRVFDEWYVDSSPT